MKKDPPMMLEIWGDLYHYRPGCTVYPPLMEGLLTCARKIQDFDIEGDYQTFLTLERADREAVLIHWNKYILICEDAWEKTVSGTANE